jgi:hypothetical protein
MLGAVLSGRGDEIIDLAKVNLLRQVSGNFFGAKRRERKQRKWLQNNRLRSQVCRMFPAGWIFSNAHG